MDLGFEGPKYTWSNRQGCDTNVKVRLDRAVANNDFLQMFEECSVDNLITTTSDHYAILISFTRNTRAVAQGPVQQGFKFEAMWLRAPDYREVLEKAWADGSNDPRSLQSTWEKLSHVASSLKDWSRTTFGSVRRKIQQLEGRLKDLRECRLSKEIVKKEKEIEGELCELFEREEIMAR
jgi:hypothetical protein